jgi:hypothetical protein
MVSQATAISGIFCEFIKSASQGGLMKDERGRLKRQRELERSGEPKQCVVCGRWFTRRPDRTCSAACAQKATAKAAGDSRRV